MSTLRLAFLSSLALEVLAAVGTALVALFLGLRLLDGSLHLAAALAVLVLAPEVYLPLRRATSEFHASTAGQAAADRILDVLDEPEQVRPLEPASPRPTGPGLASIARSTIRLSEVSVSYPSRSRPVLDRLDLELTAGEHVAVTGESGSGKSTLLSVLLGFVGPDGEGSPSGTSISPGSLYGSGDGRSPGCHSAPTSSAGRSRTISVSATPQQARRLSLGPWSTRASPDSWNGFPRVFRPRSARAA